MMPKTMLMIESGDISVEAFLNNRGKDGGVGEAWV